MTLLPNHALTSTEVNIVCECGWKGSFPTRMAARNGFRSHKAAAHQADKYRALDKKKAIDRAAGNAGG